MSFNQTELDTDLFKESLVETTGLANLLPDLLWGATRQNLTNLHHLDVYFYNWREIEVSSLKQDLDLYIKTYKLSKRPYINLGKGGFYIAESRQDLDFNLYNFLEKRHTA